MLLVIDVGNTNTVVGVYEAKTLITNWRLSTDRNRTIDEYGILFRNLFTLAKMDSEKISGIAISSVVPPLNFTLTKMAELYFNVTPYYVDHTSDTGMPIRYQPETDVGADRIVNSVAAIHHYGAPCIIVDFGTATTFDAVSKDREYLGGVITPGLSISAEALFQRAARLSRVEIKRPDEVIGQTTISSVQSGLYYGYIGLVDGILHRMIAELGADTKIIATGGLAKLIGRGSELIKEIDDDLTLEGLRIIYEKNSKK